MYVELYNRFALDCSYLQYQPEELSAATKAVAQLGLERIGQDFDLKDFSLRVEYLIGDKFPFTKVADRVAREALTIPVCKFFYAKDILNAMLKSGETPFAEMQVIVDNMTSYCIGRAFEESFRERGYSFHLLLKLAVYPDYVLPLNDFRNIEPAIKLCLSKCHYTPRLLEFIFNGIFVEHVPDFNALMRVVGTTVAMNPDWPLKGEVLVQVFRTYPKEAKAILLPFMKESPFTSELAECLEKAYAAKTLREIYPVIGKLIDFLPNLNEYAIRDLFKCPYPKVFGNDPCRLSALNRPKVATHGSIMIGIHEEAPEEMTLIAFDTKTRKLVWGMPLQNEPGHWEISPFGLAVAYWRDLLILNPENGEVKWEIELPDRLLDYDRIHFAKNGFCYFGHGKTVSGGRIESGKWEPVFQITAPARHFEPLGDFLAARDEKGNCHIINQSGGVTSLANCRSLKIKDNVLYMIDTGCVLSSQAIAPSGMLFGERQEMPLNTKKASLIDVCDDGTVVCYLDDALFQEGYPSFIDMATRQVVKMTDPFCKLFVDTKTATLWTWNQGLQKLFKHTKEGSREAGTVSGSRGFAFLHLDEQLYYTNV